MLFLRTLLIVVLGISVAVAAIPVSPMTSGIHRRDPRFEETMRKMLGMKPKAVDLPEDEELAKQRLNGLWKISLQMNPKASSKHPPGFEIILISLNIAFYMMYI